MAGFLSAFWTYHSPLYFKSEFCIMYKEEKRCWLKRISKQCGNSSSMLLLYAA